jgi:hypothetical protein
MKRNRMVAIMMIFVLALGVSSAVAQDDIAPLYKSKCQVCHGADGKDDTPVAKKIGVKDFQRFERLIQRLKRPNLAWRFRLPPSLRWFSRAGLCG